MTDLTPNTTPTGESCGTCRFAVTHTCSEQRHDQVVVKCCRFPPQPGASADGQFGQLRNRAAQARWAYTTWDDWCGEWEERLPDPEVTPEPMGFVQ